jgi:hypothetical protein
MRKMGIGGLSAERAPHADLYRDLDPNINQDYKAAHDENGPQPTAAQRREQQPVKENGDNDNSHNSGFAASRPMKKIHDVHFASC